MLFRMPYVFGMACVPKGSRKVDFFRFVDAIEVEISETDFRSIPQACRWTDARTGAASATWLHGDGHVAPGGSPRTLPGREGAVGHEGLAETLTRAYGAGQAGFYAIGDWIKKGETSVHAYREEAIREICWTDREEMREQARKLATRFVSVDGGLWHPVPEPKIQVILPNDLTRLASFGASMRVDGETDPLWYDPRPPYAQPAFRADRHADALEYARERFAAFGLDECNPVEVLVPESFTFDDEAWTVLGTAANVARRAMALLHGMDREGVMAWMAVRDGAIATDPEAAAAALAGFAPALEGSCLRDEALDALRRWDLRPIPTGAPTL